MPRPLDYAPPELNRQRAPLPLRLVAITWWVLILAWCALVFESRRFSLDSARDKGVMFVVLALWAGAGGLLWGSVCRRSRGFTKAVATLLSWATGVLVIVGLAIGLNAAGDNEPLPVVAIILLAALASAAFIGCSAWLFWRWLRELELETDV